MGSEILMYDEHILEEAPSCILNMDDSYKNEEIIVVQIAGLIARRILSFVNLFDSLKLGERFGLIRFGSRVDVYLPSNYAPKVKLGQKVVAGESINAS